MIRNHSRRQFLVGAGGVSLALPLLPSLFSQKALALGAGGQPKRLIAIQIGHGIFPEEWFPYVQGSAFPTLPLTWGGASIMTSAPYQNLAPVSEQMRDLDLTQMTGPLSPAFKNYDQSLLSKMMIIQGLSAIDGGGHNRTGMLGGYIPGTLGYVGETLDQVLARKIYTQQPILPSLNLTDMDGGDNMSVIKTSSGYQAAPMYRDSSAANSLLFGPLRSSPSAAAKLQNQQDQQTVVDFLSKDINAAMNSAKISADDKKRLQSHVDFIHQFQQRQLASAGVQCTPLAAQPEYVDGYGNYIGGDANREALETAYIDTIIGSIKCGLSDIFTVCMGCSDLDYDFLGVQGDYHGKCHARDTAHITPVRTYMLDKIAYLMKSLMDIEDPLTGATYLDNTLIMVVSEICPYAHDRADLNVMLAGNLNNYFQMGRAVSFQNYNTPSWDNITYEGRAYPRLLYTVLDAFGLAPGDVSDTFIPQNNGIHQNATFNTATEWRTPLPFMKSRTA